jgi:hypothetical protein
MDWNDVLNMKDRCETCEGSGQVVTDAVSEECPLTGGTIETPTEYGPCSDCGGNGWLSQDVPVESAAGMLAQVTLDSYYCESRDEWYGKGDWLVMDACDLVNREDYESAREDSPDIPIPFQPVMIAVPDGLTHLNVVIHTPGWRPVDRWHPDGTSHIHYIYKCETMIFGVDVEDPGRPYWQPFDGEDYGSVAGYDAHMRDMRKFGALLEWWGLRGGEK